MPVCAGDQRSMIAPCGNPTKANRFGVEPAAVWAHAVAAGFIASRSGSAMVAPTPFNTVRRETCFLNMYIVVSPLPFADIRRRPLCSRRGLRHPAHPELFAPHDRLDQR